MKAHALFLALAFAMTAHAADKDVRYYENVEGGHGAGATNAQQAHVWALTYRFLWKELGNQ